MKKESTKTETLTVTKLAEQEEKMYQYVKGTRTNEDKAKKALSSCAEARITAENKWQGLKEQLTEALRNQR